MSAALLPCPFCGGEAGLEQTGKMELTIRCIGPQSNGLRGCGPSYVQKITPRFTLEWLAGVMTDRWNRRTPSPQSNVRWTSFDDWWLHHLREADDITVLECVKKAFEAGRAAPPQDQKASDQILELLDTPAPVSQVRGDAE